MDMLCRAIPEDQRREINTIPDGSIPDLFASAHYSGNIYTLYRMGVVTGSGPLGACLPDEDIRRSEVAALIARVVDPNLRVSFRLQAPARHAFRAAPAGGGLRRSLRRGPTWAMPPPMTRLPPWSSIPS